MLSEDTINYFRFAGARALLSVFRDGRVIDHLEERDAVLEPVLRSLWLAGRSGGRNLYEVAAQVRLIADALEQASESGTGTAVPVDLGELIAAWPTDEPWRALRAVAVHTESWESGFVTKLLRATPTSWELGCRFPQLTEFLQNYYDQDGMATEEDMTEAEGLQLFIDHCHPICLWCLPPVVAECAEALAIFHSEDTLRRFFEEEHGLGSGTLAWSDWLPLIIDTFTAHMREYHAPD
ncbi:hypothetical protein SAMN04487983_103055 [Streptomyces sp. yr375]|uniref:hypothetical protein n=1 Tax=Streptomyces sp. yr375 TaxID=1761906 RepID=UPI0008BA42DA|nr:hypothetical protein [Streptomyces sp. yr375]SES07811.1 hypothetical protein SAMN04487983_103055 [Streptomyces sp. yr375]